MQTDSELESDTSSINDGLMGSSNPINNMISTSSNANSSFSSNQSINVNSLSNPASTQNMQLGAVANDHIKNGNNGQLLSREELEKRVESLVQENRVLKIEIETYKLRIKGHQEENKELRRASVSIQARAEQEEEYISNKLLKKIQSLKKEKETLANNYEREEEFLTNDLSRKLTQLRNEKVQLEQTLEQEQEHMVNKLMRKIEKLEAETSAKQTNLEQLRREKIELENTLEQEQESLVNRLWKRMERLETEKRLLQEKLEQPMSAPMSPRNSISNSSNTNSSQLPNSSQISGSLLNNIPVQSSLWASLSNSSSLPLTNSLSFGSGATSEQATTLTEHIINLRREVSRLKANLEKVEREHKKNTAKLVREEKVIREENLRLQKRLQMEVDRREALCRHLSESESSLEMDDERHFNETTRVRTVSSPVSGFILNSNSSNTNSCNTSFNNCTNGVSMGILSTSNTLGNTSLHMSSQPVAIPPSISMNSQLYSSQPLDRCPACNYNLKFHSNSSLSIKPPILPPSLHPTVMPPSTSILGAPAVSNIQPVNVASVASATTTTTQTQMLGSSKPNQTPSKS